MEKLSLLIVLLLLMALFFILDIHQYLTLTHLKNHLSDFQHWRQTSPWLTSLVFFAFYIAVTALSLPGAAILTLASGALFGLLHGLILVSFASSLGTTLAFLTARYLLRDRIEQRFPLQLKTINQGIAKDGAFYLFSLRLVPIFPFFIINLLFGLSHINSWRFYWVSQIGMLTGTLVYVNAGTQLAQIDRLGSVLSVPLLLSFTLLGLFPLVAKAVNKSH